MYRGIKILYLMCCHFETWKENHCPDSWYSTGKFHVSQKGFYVSFGTGQQHLQTDVSQIKTLVSILLYLPSVFDVYVKSWFVSSGPRQLYFVLLSLTSLWVSEWRPQSVAVRSHLVHFISICLRDRNMGDSDLQWKRRLPSCVWMRESSLLLYFNHQLYLWQRK